MNSTWSVVVVIYIQPRIHIPDCSFTLIAECLLALTQIVNLSKLIINHRSVAATMPYWMYPHLDETQLALQEKAKGDWKELTDVNKLLFIL